MRDKIVAGVKLTLLALFGLVVLPFATCLWLYVWVRDFVKGVKL